MGYNSILLLCNDAFGEVDRDPVGWWEKTKRELCGPETMRREIAEFGFGSHANGFMAVWNQHADNGVLIYAGGNRAEVLSVRHGAWRGDEADLVRLLNAAASQIGYHLVKNDD
jgi:hypothetical protein